MDKILSISIAAYNAENDVGRCLDSLVKSNVLDALDIIVVNDGSKDNTKKVVQEYVNKYSDSVRLINKENGGHGSTINASIKVARGKYYKILDSDDWFDTDNLNKFINYLKTVDVDMVLNPYVEVSYSNHNDIRVLNPCKNDTEIEKIFRITSLNDGILLYMHSLTFSTKVIKSMGSIIDEHCFYVDMEYSMFPMLYVKNYVILDYPLYQYLLGSQDQSMNVQNLIKRRDQHLKVVKRIIEFYKDNQENLIKNVKEVLVYRIKYATYQQYKIYLEMNAKESKEEIIEFDKWLKETSSEAYDGPTGRVMQFIKLNRFTNFKLFIPLLNAFKSLGLYK